MSTNTSWKLPLRWFPAIIFAVMIFYFSSLPDQAVGNAYTNIQHDVQQMAPRVIPYIIHNPLHIDWLKVGHFIGYFCFGLSIAFALPQRSRWTPVVLVLICSLYALSDEFHQCFAPGRSASVNDVILDTVYASIGIVVFRLIPRKKPKKT